MEVEKLKNHCNHILHTFDETITSYETYTRLSTMVMYIKKMCLAETHIYMDWWKVVQALYDLEVIKSS